MPIYFTTLRPSFSTLPADTMELGDFSVRNANNVILSDSKIHKSSSSVSPVAPTALNPRSCVSCSRRKVKCDRRNTCYHCTKANVDCVFPPSSRIPRKPRKLTESDLAERLRRLEGFVQSLRAPVQTDEAGLAPKVRQTAGLRPQIGELMQETEEEEKAQPIDANRVADRFGRLIITEDSSRYISPGLWSHLNAEVCYH
jgi:hypothetical protein